MKVKLFSLTLLWLMGLLATANTTFAQATTYTDNSDLSSQQIKKTDTLADVMVPILIADYPIIKNLDFDDENPTWKAVLKVVLSK